MSAGILLTGATGYVGGRLLQRFEESGWRGLRGGRSPRRRQLRTRRALVPVHGLLFQGMLDRIARRGEAAAVA